MSRPVGLALFCSLVVLAEGCRAAAREEAAPSVRLDAAASSLGRVTRACHLLQGGPAERRAECCGGGAGSHLESACVRELNLALTLGRIELDDAKVERCSEASAVALGGCDWVTPGQPVPPAECEGLTRGRVGLGGTCRSSLECELSFYCEGSTPSQGGRCTAPKAAGESCSVPTDALAGYLFARDLDRTHPTCAGECSLVSHRCEAPAAMPMPAGEPPPAKATSAVGKLSGEACLTDFDCRAGGCSGTPGTCGMKCSVSFADMDRFASLPPLALPRRSPR
jgi:hypothetical protein